MSNAAGRDDTGGAVLPLTGGGAGGGAQADGRLRDAGAARARCLLVASNFPSVRGGSAVAYGNLCRWAGDAVSVLAPTTSYQSGRPLEGWRELDRGAPFPVHRLPLLRPLSARPRSRLHGL